MYSCTVCVTIYSYDSIIPPGFRFTELQALTLAARFLMLYNMYTVWMNTCINKCEICALYYFQVQVPLKIIHVRMWRLLWDIYWLTDKFSSRKIYFRRSTVSLLPMQKNRRRSPGTRLVCSAWKYWNCITKLYVLYASPGPTLLNRDTASLSHQQYLGVRKRWPL